MLLSILILILTGYGYMSGEVWAIAGSIILAFFLVRETVFAFNKAGMAISFSLLFMVVIVGIVSIPDDHKNEGQEKISQATPPRVLSKQTLARTPVDRPKSVTSTSTPESPTGEPNKAHMAQLQCAEQQHFDGMALGKDDIDSLYIKLCATTTQDDIEIYFAPEIRPIITFMTWFEGVAVDVNSVGIRIIPDVDFFRISPNNEKLQDIFTKMAEANNGYVVVHALTTNSFAFQDIRIAMAITEPTPELTNNTERILGDIQIPKPDFEEMACAEKTHLDQTILGKNNMNTFYLKICPDTEPVVISYDKSVYWERVMWDIWLQGVTQVFNNNYVSSIIKREDDAVLIIPKQAEIKKVNADYVIVRFYINTNERL